MLFLFFYFLSNYFFEKVDEIEVAQIMILNDFWLSSGEVKWWMEEQRYKNLNPWLHYKGFYALWQINKEMEGKELEDTIHSVFNRLKIDRRNEIKNNYKFLFGNN